MNNINFEDFYNNTIIESVIDIPRNSLDPTVFQFNDGMSPILNPSIKLQILEDIRQFEKIVLIQNFFIIGSILTKNYNKNSDIDVTIQVAENDIDNISNEGIIHLLNSLNGKMAIGTIHPINYYIILKDYDFSKTEAAYDIANEIWIKEPKIIELNLTNYIDKFHNKISKIDLTTAELRREIIDFDELKQFNPNEIKDLKHIMQMKLYEIQKTIENLLKYKKKIKKDREESFDKDLTPEEIKKYSDKNSLPQNVIYKLLQKYYYSDFLSRLKQIYNDSGNEIDSNEIKNIKKAFNKNLWKDNYNFEEFYNLKETKNIKVSKVNWKSPERVKNYRSQNLHRGMNRVKLQQIPDKYKKIISKNQALNDAKSIVNIAKEKPFGVWKLSPLQLRSISYFYHFIPPTKQDPVKHLGNTGIIVWRKSEGDYFLVKSKDLHV